MKRETLICAMATGFQLTRNGHDRPTGYTWIVDEARRLRQRQFSKLGALYSRKHDEELPFRAMPPLPPARLHLKNRLG